MFGYVRPALALLSEEDRERYQGAYCGLCHAMGRRHGFLARFSLSYDFTFLAILFTGGEGAWCGRKCPVHPLKKRRTCLSGCGLDAAADASLILSWYKLGDDVEDESWFRGIPARLLRFILRRPFSRARAARPEFARRVELELERLRRMEAQRSRELDRVADAFACTLREAAPQQADEALRRVMEQVLYHLGRWIYLVDAWDDLEDDRRAERYNPLDARFDGRAREEKEYLATTMTHSLKLAISAANLADFGVWNAVVENILYQGLPSVQAAVLSGQWERKTHRETRE